MLIYLDQNYASRIAKHLLGQQGHQPFDVLYERLLSYEVLCPASTFHVLELRGGYLCPPFQEFFPKLQRGLWVRPWQDILALQVQHSSARREDFLTSEGSWEHCADLDELAWIEHFALEGHLNKRVKQARNAICEDRKIDPNGPKLPFVETMARLMAFRSMNNQRDPRGSDFADMVIAATTQPYVDILATDRFVREALDRTGLGKGVYSGRYPDVYRLLQDLQDHFAPPAPA
ncbi:MAG: hypothetical protein H6728_10755 [Myxococcales bacterium]|nr:hypothetical protein [Myxococcales bacterium]MCB9643539.1 hypothetical protein [Myxococcales bacterium]